MIVNGFAAPYEAKRYFEQTGLEWAQDARATRSSPGAARYVF
jgi:hypothetical protein